MSCGVRDASGVRRVPDHPARTTCSSLVASTERWFRCRAARYGRPWPGCGRQIDIHCEAAFGERLRPHATFVGCGHRRDDRQPEAETGDAAVARVVQPVEAFEQLVSVCGVDMAAAVRDVQPTRFPSVRVSSEIHPRSRLCRTALSTRFATIRSRSARSPVDEGRFEFEIEAQLRARPPRVRLVRQRNAPWPRDYTARTRGFLRRSVRARAGCR